MIPVGRVARLQSLFGVLLAAWLLAHLWQQWPVLEGREAWVDRARHFALPTIGKALLALTLLGHLVFGALRVASGPHPADAVHGPGIRRVQMALGVILLGFIAAHLPLVHWEPGPHSTVRDVFATLWTQLGQPANLALYTLGIGAACAHVGLGLGRAAVTFDLAHSARARAVAHWVAAIAAAALFVCFLQVLACFAIGEPLFVLPTSP